jgi:hypothetical protein
MIMYYLTDEDRWETWKGLEDSDRMQLVKKYFPGDEYTDLINSCPAGTSLKDHIMYCDLTKNRVCAVSKMAEEFSIAIGMFLEEKLYGNKSSDLLSSQH